MLHPWRLLVARTLTRRLGRIFLRDDQGRRAVFGDDKKLQTDRHCRDSRLFYEVDPGTIGGLQAGDLVVGSVVFGACTPFSITPAL